MIISLYQRAALALTLALAVNAPATADSRPLAPALQPDWSGWRLPLPAGEWRITRGPCDSVSQYDHACDYYENSCAFDYVPMAGRMDGVPVLAPAPGEVFFVGTRENTGHMVLLKHPDGRISGYMHLEKVVVGRETQVKQGAVIGYAGRSGTTEAHLHFWVQANAVQRSCLDITTLEEQDLAKGLARSTNLAWSQLDLIDPPTAVPNWLPILGADGSGSAVWRLPARITVPAGGAATVPVAVRATGAALTLRVGDLRVTPVAQTTDSATFLVPLQASASVGLRTIGLVLYGSGQAISVRLVVATTTRQPVAGLAGTVLINPVFVSPANYAVRTGKASLCWAGSPEAGPAPLRYRVLVVRDLLSAATSALPTTADSGWIADTCYTTPELAPGTYFWKVFVLDGAGLMNRTNQRPLAFVIR